MRRTWRRSGQWGENTSFLTRFTEHMAYISAQLASDGKKGTGFSEDDLKVFWEALNNMFDDHRSAARGEMSARKLLIFQHESALGNAPAHMLFETVSVKRVAPDGREEPEPGFGKKRPSFPRRANSPITSLSIRRQAPSCRG